MRNSLSCKYPLSLPTANYQIERPTSDCEAYDTKSTGHSICCPFSLILDNQSLERAASRSKEGKEYQALEVYTIG